MHAIIVAAVLAASLTATFSLQAEGTSVGSNSCASSTCHGAVSPSTRSDILHNEFTTWQQQDKHAQAFAALQSPAALRMGKKLQLAEKPAESAQCLSCHSPAAINPATEAKTAPAPEGVGCETCHGPAGLWLDSHNATGASHANSLTRGMYPTDQPAAQVRLCVSCHVGDSDRQANHALMAAGHPRLSFELATFTAMRGYHQHFDADWQARKGPYQPLQLWALGQLHAAQQNLNRLAEPSHTGLFPELSLYDCHSCHQAAKVDQPVGKLPPGKPSLGKLPPGKLQLNDSYLLMTAAAIQVLQPDQYPAFASAISTLQEQISTGSSQSVALTSKQLITQLTMVSEQIATEGLGDATQINSTATALLDALIAQSDRYRNYSDAEQAYMAAATFVDIQRQHSGSNTQIAQTKVDSTLAALRNCLSDEDHYQPATFAQALAELRQSLMNTPE
jgi:hypothetical protein